MTADYLRRALITVAAIAAIYWGHPGVSGEEPAPRVQPFAGRFRTQVEQLEKGLENKNRDYPDLWAVRKISESFGTVRPEDTKWLMERLRTAKPVQRRDLEEIEAELATFIVVRALSAKEAEAFFRKVASEQRFPIYASLGLAVLDIRAALRFTCEQVERAKPRDRMAWYVEGARLIAICGEQKDLDALDKLVPGAEQRFDLTPVLRYRESLSEKDRVLLQQQETVLWINGYNDLWVKGAHPPRCDFSHLHAYFVCRQHKFATHLLRDRLHNPEVLWILFYQEGKGCRPTIEKLLGELEAGTFKRKSPYGSVSGECDLADACRGILGTLDRKDPANLLDLP